MKIENLLLQHKHIRENRRRNQKLISAMVTMTNENMKISIDIPTRVRINAIQKEKRRFFTHFPSTNTKKKKTVSK
jgi:hypothetical protein